MNAIIKREVVWGAIQGIQLPIHNQQHVIAQYADDTSLTMRREEDLVQCTIFILKMICASSELDLN